MSDWQNTPETPRVTSVKGLLALQEDVDAKYLAGTIDRAEWVEQLREVDEKLAVTGLRLAVRPWATK